MGKLLAWLVPFRNSSNMFFFFPYWHVGGAEKVHADIVRCFRDERPWVFFTHRSFDSKFREMFEGSAKLFNVWSVLKYTLPLSVGVLSGFINRHRSPVVFGCNSRFFYKMVPYLGSNVRRIDLMHAFGGGSEDFSLPVVDSLDARVIINGKTLDDFRKQYESRRLDPKYLDRIVLIENSIEVPGTCPPKDYDGRLRVVYVGRGSEEKRVHLVGRVATACKVKGVDAEFIFVGNVIDAVREEDRASGEFVGEISDQALLKTIYCSAHTLLVTSSREGFPVVIMEAMAHGVVPISTAVGGIPVHVKDRINGFLTNELTEDGIVEEIISIIQELVAHRHVLETTSHAAYVYAREHFDARGFCEAYRNLLLGECLS